MVILLLLQLMQISFSATFYTGVNLAGLEFGHGAKPGTVNVDYAVPTNAEIDYFVAQGMNIFRLPFLWERLQPAQNSSFVPTYQRYLTDFVDYATSKGAKVIIDPHNYARYVEFSSALFCKIFFLFIFLARYYDVVIGNGVPISAFANLWIQLANLWKNNNNVMFGLMNEPHCMIQSFYSPPSSISDL